MSLPKKWNPLTEWESVTIQWEKIQISKEDLRQFMQRSDLKGLVQSFSFLGVFILTGGLAWFALTHQLWILMATSLYLHGSFYNHFGDALHELGHNTVFKSKFLNTFMTGLFGWLFWTWNPHLYRLSHVGYHHRYTLHQKSDGEDTPNTVELTPKLIFSLFFSCIHPIELARNLARLFTLKPTSKGWRGRGYPLDEWEQFILKEATEPQRKQVYRTALFSLVSHTLFVVVCVATGLWFLLVLITLAPFYGARWHAFICSTHQHAACEANHPDYRISCGDAILDPLSSLLYWRMEYHIEHHMFASIPCYNLKVFSRFAADQLPAKEHALPRLLKLNIACKEKYGSWKYWRDNFGLYKGF